MIFPLEEEELVFKQLILITMEISFLRDHGSSNILIIHAHTCMYTNISMTAYFKYLMAPYQLYRLLFTSDLTVPSESHTMTI